MDPIAFLTSILTSDAFASLLLTAVASGVTALTGAIIYYVRKRILKDLDATELAQLREIAAQAVRYAEQRFRDAEGDVKLAQAMAAADAMLTGYGIKVSTTMLRTVIEAAVYTALAQATSDEAANGAIITPEAGSSIEVTPPPAEPVPAESVAPEPGGVDASIVEAAPTNTTMAGRRLRLHGK